MNFKRNQNFTRKYNEIIYLKKSERSFPKILKEYSRNSANICRNFKDILYKLLKNFRENLKNNFGKFIKVLLDFRTNSQKTEQKL